MLRPHNTPFELSRHIADKLAKHDAWGYHHGGPAATEPTALAALACMTLDQTPRAITALRWLATIQSDDGSIGVSAQQSAPRWPTALAVLAWTAYEQTTQEKTRPSFSENIDRAVKSMLTIQGNRGKSDEEIEHDSTLVGWPWVEKTHSWIEPTALHVLGLQATGHGGHPRVGEAKKLLLNRILPDGGCNYGNTFVLGQKLLPHTQPTGLTLMALADQNRSVGLIQKTVDWLQATLSAKTTTASLCFGLLGLAAHGLFPEPATGWIRAAYHRTIARDKSPYKLALLALAGLKEHSPLITLPRKSMSDGK